MSDGTKAVFLSYASQDSEAAKKICDALRAAGLEVWFDQSELVGGDAWDAKIRRQIADCALFVPVISANTQARREGYFRLEWKLAAQRTHMMSEQVAFLLPVVVDETRDAVADVPGEFKAVQWTRLPAGETPPAFCARVLKLLEGGSSSRETAPVVPAAAPASRELGLARKRFRPWLMPALLGAVVVGALAFWHPWGKTAPPTPTGDGPVAAVAAKPPARTDVESLLARVRKLTGKTDVMRTELDTASNLLEQAAKLDATDATIWAEWALLDRRYVQEEIDNSAARRDAARRHAAQAASLDAGQPVVRLAQALVMLLLGDDPATKTAAAKILEPLLAEIPEDGRVPLEIGWAVHDPKNPEVALAWFDRAGEIPGLAGRAHFARANVLWHTGAMGRGLAEIDAALAAERASRFLLDKSYLLTIWEGDVAAAKRVLAEIPPQYFVEDFPAAARYFVEMRAREYDKAVAALRAVPHDYLAGVALVGPSGYYKGYALARAGKTVAAQLEWRSALALVEQRLAAQPNDALLLQFKALLLSSLGEPEKAGQAWKAQRELYGDGAADNWMEPVLNMQLLPPAQAFDWLAQAVEAGLRYATAAELRLDPTYDPVRADPRFPALLAKAEADPRLSPAAAKSGLSSLPAAVAPDQKSVAVLAFANLSDDKGNEYFSDGISEELLHVLAKVPGLKVSARTSAFYFKGKEVPIPEIARQLGVAYVVEGSVRKQGDKVRIIAQLIKAADGFHVWSDTFTRDLKDIFAVQDEIAGLIAKNLELKMGMVAARPTIDVEAYEEYLTGRALVAKAGNSDLLAAVGHFEKAVAIEPKFTAAWVQLASAHTQLGRWGGAPTQQAWPAARAAIDRALALEPDSPDALVALGWILRTAEWNWRGAEQAYRRALELRPNHPETLAGAAVLLYNIGQDEEAFRLGQQAAQLDPLNPATQLDLSIMFYLSSKWEAAERTARRALALAPGGAGYHGILAWGLMGQRRYDEAEAEAKLDSDQVQQATVLGLVAVARGQIAAARAQVARMEKLARTDPDRADLQLTIAWISAALGEKDHAFAALDKARASRDPSISWLRNGSQLASLFSDPRWDELLRKVGLTDDQLK